MSSATAEASPARSVIRRLGDVSRAYGGVIGSRAYFPIALALLFIYGVNTSTGMVVFNSTVQGAVPDSVRQIPEGVRAQVSRVLPLRRPGRRSG